MAIADYRIEDEDLDGKKVTDQEYVLTGTPAQNQQVFDDYPDVITEKYNGLVDYLTENPPATTDEVYPVGAIIAKSAHTTPTFTGTWVELTGLTLTLTMSSSTSTLYFYQRTV